MLHLQPKIERRNSKTAEARTLELILTAAEDRHERLIAELRALGFQRFWQEKRRLRAYVPAARWSDRRQAEVEKQLRALEVQGPLVFQPVAEKNWNVFWEETLVPVTAGPFLIQPTWAETPADRDARFVLEIDPKMSFGTGHHATTRLALRLLAETVRGGERVLDAGTGTGILSLAALRLGAASALAFDTDARVLENAAENIEHNGAAGRVKLRAGTLAEAVPETGFDLILANINRNALSQMMPAFREKLNPGGHAILGGLLLSDRAPLLKRAAACGFSLEEELTEDEWWAGQVERG